MGFEAMKPDIFFFTPDSMVAVLNQPFRGDIRSIDIVHPLTFEVQTWEEYIDAPFSVDQIDRIVGSKPTTNLFITHSGDVYDFRLTGFKNNSTLTPV